MNRTTHIIRLAGLAAVAIAATAACQPAMADKTKDKDKAKDKAEAPVYPVAIFPFQERGRDVSELGNQVTDLLFANLVAEPEMYLVDREDMKKILDEQELNLSGLVNPATAARVGHLTGAKILVTGSVLQSGESLYVIAKVIGTETSRVLGASVKGGAKDELDGLVEQLAEKVHEVVTKRGGDLVAQPVTREDRLAALQKQMGKGRRPKVFVDISERHVGQAAIDPAAETEVVLFCRELGFEVIDPDEGDRSDADVLLLGEGFSEFATRHGNLISIKARLELKAVDADTGRVLAADRHTSVAVDLTEQVAGKTALQEAAANLASRVLPKLVEPAKGKKPAKRNRN